MDDRRREWLELAGVQLALVAAGLHLFWGVPRAFVYLRVGQLTDPRPFVFTLSAAAVVAAVVWLYRGGPERRLYAFLAAVMAVYLVGYAAWHLVGHPVLDPAGGVLVTYHPDDALAVLAGHLAGDRFALAAAVVETGAILVFGMLLAMPDRRDGTP